MHNTASESLFLDIDGTNDHVYSKQQHWYINAYYSSYRFFPQYATKTIVESEFAQLADWGRADVSVRF